MSSIHYFQRYSQPENVATNNTLLLLSRLYHQTPGKFKAFINDLLNDADMEAGIQFNQQTRGKSSIPDAYISQISFKVVVETKLHKHFSLNQLLEHLGSFGLEQYQILLSLSPKPPDISLQQKIIKAVTKYNASNKARIKYLPITFQEIVTKFNSCLEDTDFELIETINDYEAYCFHDHLITDEESKMRVVTCGWTLDDNFKYNIYYDPVDRGYSDHKYLGIYSGKSVKGIGKIENIISAELKKNKQLQIIDYVSPVTTKVQNNIKAIIEAAKLNYNWDISKGHKFFCVDKFYETDFRKTTKYPIQRTKFFDLRDVLNVKTLPLLEEIAQQLRQFEW
jgi:hypothetical protein